MGKKRNPIERALDRAAEQVGRETVELIKEVVGRLFTPDAAHVGPERAQPETRRTSPPRPSCYAVLGVAERAPREVVDAAYRVLSKVAHPDAGGSEARFKTLTAARDTIYTERGWK